VVLARVIALVEAAPHAAGVGVVDARTDGRTHLPKRLPAQVQVLRCLGSVWFIVFKKKSLGVIFFLPA
jgi:hypothetical protein